MHLLKETMHKIYPEQSEKYYCKLCTSEETPFQFIFKDTINILSSLTYFIARYITAVLEQIAYTLWPSELFEMFKSNNTSLLTAAS